MTDDQTRNDTHSSRDPLSRRVVLRGGVLFGLAAAAGAAVEVTGRSSAAAAPGSAVVPDDPHATIRLAQDGTTKYRVYCGTEEDDVVRHAADELASYLTSVTGARFTVITASRPPSGDHLLVVGRRNPVAERLADRIDYSRLGDDGFALRLSGQSLLIAGPSTRGTLYGAYWVLDRLVGVRWFAPDYTVIPRKSTVELRRTDLNRDHVPRFRYRNILTGDAEDAAYRQHNMLNGLRDQYWTVPRPKGIDTWSHYWPEERPYSSFQKVVTDQSLWYGGQLKLMDPAMRAAAADGLVQVIRDRIVRGEDNSAAFDQEDRGWTPDPASRAFADTHGGALSAPVVDMINDLANRVSAQIPGARLETQAYLWSFQPPTGMTVNDNVVITTAPIHADFAHSLFSDKNQEFGTGIRTWCEMARNVVLWDYLTTYTNYMLPFPDWWAMCASITTLAELPSAQGYFGEGAWNASGTEFSQLRVWVLSRLVWDPTLDADALIREFLDGYYGPAAPHLYRYMQLMHQSVLDTGTKLTMNVSELAGYFNFDTMRQADTLFDQAEAAVAGDGTLLDHVRALRLGVDFVILSRTAQFIRDAAAAGISWNPDTHRRLARFEAEIRIAGLTRVSESGGSPDDLVARFHLLETISNVPSAPPAAVAGLPASDWVDFQEPTLKLHPPVTTILADAAAANGYTVRMPGNRSDWGVQVPLSLLPAEGTWRFYMSVRIDKGTAAPGATAIRGGVYPPSGNTVSVPVSAFTDGEYLEIALPGTYQYDPVLIAYVAPPASAQIPYVYIDRLFAVRS